MAVCELTGKRKRFGKTIQHQYGGQWAKEATGKSREFRANINTSSVFIDGFKIQYTVSARAMKNPFLIQKLYKSNTVKKQRIKALKPKKSK
jgi:ribosomal protein L28